MTSRSGNSLPMKTSRIQGFVLIRRAMASGLSVRIFASGLTAARARISFSVSSLHPRTTVSRMLR